jgi:PAS domain S-box-containing protein
VAIRILNVENDRGYSVALQAALEAAGAAAFELDVDGSLAEMEARLDSSSCDLLLLSLELRGNRGLTVVEQVREAMPGVPVLMMSESGGEDRALAAVSAGAQDYLVKGVFPLEALPRVVRYAVERASAEGTRHRSEQRNRSILEAIPDGLFQVDEAGIYLDFVPGRSFMPYANPEDFIGRAVVEVLPEPVGAGALKLVQAAIRTGEIQQFEYEFRQADKLFSFEARAVPVGDREAMVVVRDVSDLRLAEAALRENAEKIKDQAERLRVLVEAATLISAKATPDEIQDACLDGITRVVECDRVVYQRVDAKKRTIVPLKWRGALPPSPGEPRREGMPGMRLLDEQLPYVLVADSLDVVKHHGTRSVAGCR